jgi:NAD(P)-dependent dehydrogenase (short-subunit alcohol dehydrogenase family)
LSWAVPTAFLYIVAFVGLTGAQVLLGLPRTDAIARRRLAHFLDRPQRGKAMPGAAEHEPSNEISLPHPQEFSDGPPADTNSDLLPNLGAQAEPGRASAGVVLVTGAASGIGRELILQLARQGWQTAAIDQDRAGLKELEHQLRLERLGLAWRVADVTDAVLMKWAVASLSERLGPIDLLIASAGIAAATPATAADPDAIARIIGVNLIGVSNTIAAVISGMVARQSGHIVAISSLASFRGLPAMMGYSASKAGLNALMQSLWLDVKRQGICVTTVCPGYTRTPQSEGSFRDQCLMPVGRAAGEILWAIARRKRFHAFPRLMVLRLRLIALLPAWLQDWLLIRHQAQVVKV